MADEKFVYLKLGPHATLFVDQQNQVNIAGKKVVKILESSFNASKSLARAVTSTHIVKATEKEFNAYEAGAIEVPTGETDEQKTQKAKRAGQQVAKKEKKTAVEGKGLEGDDDDDKTQTEWSQEDLDDLTKGEMADELKEAKDITEDELKGLNKLDKPGLQELYKKYIPYKASE